jgi:hypothetical protein
MDGYDEVATIVFQKALKSPAWDANLFDHTTQRADLLQLNERFLSEVKEIRTRFSIDIQKYQYQQDAQQWTKDVYPKIKDDWDTRVSSLMQIANLMSGWRVCINTYVLTCVMIPPPEIRLHDSKDEHGQPALQIEIIDPTSSASLEILLKHIEIWTEYYGYRQRIKKKPYPLLPYYKIMYFLRSIGLKNAEIAETMRANFDNESDPSFTTRFVRDKLNAFDLLIKEQL